MGDGSELNVRIGEYAFRAGWFEQDHLVQLNIYILLRTLQFKSFPLKNFFTRGELYFRSEFVINF